MPVLLEKGHISKWLDTKSVAIENFISLSTSFHEDGIEIYPVDQKVNKPAYDAPDCIGPQH